MREMDNAALQTAREERSVFFDYAIVFERKMKDGVELEATRVCGWDDDRRRSGFPRRLRRNRVMTLRASCVAWA